MLCPFAMPFIQVRPVGLPALRSHGWHSHRRLHKDNHNALTRTQEQHLRFNEGGTNVNKAAIAHNIYSARAGTRKTILLVFEAV